MNITSIHQIRQLPKPGQANLWFMSCPRLMAAVGEVQNNTQAPYPLVLMSAISAISVAVQGIADVKKPTGQKCPASVMVCVVANSGERKTTVEDIFMRAIRKYQDEQNEVYQEELEKWRARHAAWEVKKQAILSSIKKKALGDAL